MDGFSLRRSVSACRVSVFPFVVDLPESVVETSCQPFSRLAVDVDVGISPSLGAMLTESFAICWQQEHVRLSFFRLTY